MFRWHSFPEKPDDADDMDTAFVVHIEFLYKQASGNWWEDSTTFIGVWDSEDYCFWDRDGDDWKIDPKRYGERWYKDVRGWWAYAYPADGMRDHEKAFYEAQDARELRHEET